MIKRLRVQDPRRNGGKILCCRVSFLHWLLFQYLFRPYVTAVSCKRSQSFCRKCRSLVAGYSYAHIHPTYVALNEMTLQTGAWLNGAHRTCAERVAVSRGTSHATTKNCCQYTTSVDIKNTCYKRIQSVIQNHMPMCAVSLLESRE